MGTWQNLHLKSAKSTHSNSIAKELNDNYRECTQEVALLWTNCVSIISNMTSHKNILIPAVFQVKDVLYVYIVSDSTKFVLKFSTSFHLKTYLCMFSLKSERGVRHGCLAVPRAPLAALSACLIRDANVHWQPPEVGDKGSYCGCLWNYVAVWFQMDEGLEERYWKCWMYFEARNSARASAMMSELWSGMWWP